MSNHQCIKDIHVGFVCYYNCSTCKEDNCCKQQVGRHVYTETNSVTTTTNSLTKKYKEENVLKSYSHSVQ